MVPRPKRAVLSDANPHIMRFYEAIRAGEITSGKVRAFLEGQHELLQAGGQEHHSEIRARFNCSGDSLDFLFLNRSCFSIMSARGRFAASDDRGIR